MVHTRHSSTGKAEIFSLQLSEELISDTSTEDGAVVPRDTVPDLNEDDDDDNEDDEESGLKWYHGLRDVIKFLKCLRVSDARKVCQRLRVPHYMDGLEKSKVINMLMEHLHALASECSQQRFNDLVNALNQCLMLAGTNRHAYRLSLLPPVVDAAWLLRESSAIMRWERRPTIPAALRGSNGREVVSLLGPVHLDVIGHDTPFICGLDFTDAHLQGTNHRILIACYTDLSSEILRKKGWIVCSGFRGLTATNITLFINAKPIRKYRPFGGTPLWDITEACQRGQNRLLVEQPIKGTYGLAKRSGLVLEVLAAWPNLPSPTAQAPIAPAPAFAPTISARSVAYPMHALSWTEIFTKEPMKIEAADALARIKAKYVKTGEGSDADADDDDVLGSTLIPLSLKCPLTLRRIERPVRLEACGHVQCFDYASWAVFGQTTVMPSTHYSAEKKAMQAGCPVCGEALKAGSTVVEDGWFALLLQEYAGQPGVARVLFDAATETHEAALVDPDGPSDQEIDDDEGMKENDNGNGNGNGNGNRNGNGNGNNNGNNNGNKNGSNNGNGRGTRSNVFDIDKSDEVLETIDGREMDPFEAYELRVQQGIRPDRPIVID